MTGGNSFNKYNQRQRPFIYKKLLKIWKKNIYNPVEKHVWDMNGIHTPGKQLANKQLFLSFNSLLVNWKVISVSESGTEIIKWYMFGV